MSEEDYKQIFSKNLRHYLTINNKTQSDLISDLALSSSTVSNWCTGQKMPRMNKVQMLADYFGIEKSDLIEDKSVENNLPELTRKDERDIAKDLSATLADLETSQTGLMFDGEPLDDETRELLKISLENSMRLGKQIAKQKYTNKRYKKD